MVNLITVERRRQSTRTKTCTARLLCTGTPPTCENLHRIQGHHTAFLLHLPELLWPVTLNRTFCTTAYGLGESKNGRFNWHGTTTTSNSTGGIQLNLPEPTPASTASHVNAAYPSRHQIRTCNLHHINFDECLTRCREVRR
jgi:hypothetical protein